MVSVPSSSSSSSLKRTDVSHLRTGGIKARPSLMARLKSHQTKKSATTTTTTSTPTTTTSTAAVTTPSGRPSTSSDDDDCEIVGEYIPDDSPSAAPSTSYAVRTESRRTESPVAPPMDVEPATPVSTTTSKIPRKIFGRSGISNPATEPTVSSRSGNIYLCYTVYDLFYPF